MSRYPSLVWSRFAKPVLSGAREFKSPPRRFYYYLIYFFFDDYLVFFFAGRRPAVAGLLGVLGASMSGPVSESAPRGVAPSGRCWSLRSLIGPSRALSDVYTFGAKRPLP